MTQLISRNAAHTGAILAAVLATVALLLVVSGCGSEDSALVAHAGQNMALLVGRPARLDGSRSRHTGGRPIEFH